MSDRMSNGMPDKKAAARLSAESRFKRKQEQTREGAEAMAEYEAKAEAARQNMARLRALRLARDVADNEAAAKAAAEKKAGTGKTAARKRTRTKAKA